MPAVAIVGAAVLGAASTVYSVNRQKKAANRQAARVDEQEKQAKIEARERAGLGEARDESGADIRLGRGDGAAKTSSVGSVLPAATSRTGAVGSRVGGITSQKPAGGLGKLGRAVRGIGL